MLEGLNQVKDEESLTSVSDVFEQLAISWSVFVLFTTLVSYSHVAFTELLFTCNEMKLFVMPC